MFSAMLQAGFTSEGKAGSKRSSGRDVLVLRLSTLVYYGLMVVGDLLGQHARLR